uniref:HAT C-terminal dimerisation domain-containing protein n=1 Tax=Panagrolaimus sp. ES5 TaxID=591445 RepID=A0AC34G0P3_9BILA
MNNSSILDDPVEELGNPPSKKARNIFSDVEKKEIKDKLKNNEYNLKPVQDDNDIMKYIVDGKTRKAVLCSVCGTLLSAKGGGSISYHRNGCVKLTSCKPFTMNQDDRKEIISKVLSSVVTNYLPAALFNNIVFLDLLQTVHNLGYKIGFDCGKNLSAKDAVVYGPSSISDIMPHRTNIRRTLDRTVAEKFPLLIDFVSKSLSGIGGALTCDMTTKLYHYVGYSIHFITPDWKLVCLPICMKEFSEKPTAENILNDAIQFLNEFSIILSELIFVSDEGSSVVAAFKRQRQIICIDHGLSTIGKRGIDPYKETKRMPIRLSPAAKAAIEEINCLVKDVKSLVQFVKRRPSINTRLSNRLILDAETRWISKLHMVIKILDMSSEDTNKLREFLTVEDPTKLQKFNLIRHKTEKLKIFVELYQPLMDSIKTLEAENKPTLYLVPIIYSKLLNYFKEEMDSSDTTKAGLAESLFKVMEYKQIDGLFSRLAEEGAQVLLGEGENSSNGISKFNSRKRQRQHCTIDLEIDEFITCSVPETDVENFSLLTWWKQNSHRFPRLSALARKYHSIPASSASIERLFSVLNMLTPDERLSLTPEALENMIKLRTLLHAFP